MSSAHMLPLTFQVPRDSLTRAVIFVTIPPQEGVPWAHTRCPGKPLEASFTSNPPGTHWRSGSESFSPIGQFLTEIARLASRPDPLPATPHWDLINLAGTRIHPLWSALL